MENDVRINQLIQVLQMREETFEEKTGLRTVYPTVSGTDRALLISELVKLLTIE